MDKPDTLATLGTHDTGQTVGGKINGRENRRDNREWTIQRHQQHQIHKTQERLGGKSMVKKTAGNKMANPETLATLGTQDTGQTVCGKINGRENRRGNRDWTIQRHWQHWVQKTQDK